MIRRIDERCSTLQDQLNQLRRLVALDTARSEEQARRLASVIAESAATLPEELKELRHTRDETQPRAPAVPTRGGAKK